MKELPESYHWTDWVWAGAGSTVGIIVVYIAWRLA